jgi:ppGpp synthetase/RelA/SpoT-type nucleotidyltranferase
MTALSDARRRFIEERPQFELLAQRVETEIRALVRTQGIDCQVSGRAKDVASFVGKCLRKGYTDPWNQVTDKVGVRITVSDPSSIDAVVALVSDRYDNPRLEDKNLELREKQRIGYGGVHVQVEVASPTESVGGECEIQVRTAAQNLWSEMSHKLLYKPGVEPDDETERALLRLAALMEIFDEEVTRRVKLIVSTAGYPIEELINAAEAHFYQFTDVNYDRALSRFVLSEIAEALPADQTSAYVDRLKAFAAANGAKLTAIFERYRDIDTAQLVHQPEAIIIFERLESDAYTLRASWESRLPIDELDSLESIWGA